MRFKSKRTLAVCSLVVLLFFFTKRKQIFSDTSHASLNMTLLHMGGAIEKSLCEPYPTYKNPSGETPKSDTATKAFPFSKRDLAYYGLLVAKTLKEIPPPEYIANKVVFVTAASETYFWSALESISLVQQYLPHIKIIFYDLGISPPSLTKIGNREDFGITDLCNVEYRKFNYSRYPPHVKDKHTYAWKFLIIQEVLQTQEVIFWMDSSIKFLNSNFNKVLRQRLESPVVLRTYTGHNNFVVTFPETFSYLPTNTTKQKHINQYEANNMLIINTKGAYDNILKWMYLCSLTKECISPNGSRTGCNGFGANGQHHGNCHRFDQTAVNILLSNYYNYEPQKYRFDDTFRELRPYRVNRGMMLAEMEQLFYGCKDGAAPKIYQLTDKYGVTTATRQTYLRRLLSPGIE